MLERHTHATAERAEETHHSALTKGLLLTLGILLLTYTVVRAVTVSFSWDENWTFIHHVLKGVFYQRNYDAMGGNHHLLNVWAMWLSWKLLGSSVLALRLPNLLAHVIYLYATGRIALKARSGFLAVAAFVLLNAHPYLLDLFSLARGYGLSCGWMMLALWHSWRYFNEGQPVRQVLWAAVYASLSAMSHVIMINFLLALELAFLIMWAAQSRRMGLLPWKRHVLALCVTGAAGLAVILPDALGLLHGGSLNFGCDSVWDCMVRTLGEKVLYHQPYATPVLTIMATAIACVTAVCLLTWIMAFRGGWLSRARPMLFGTLVLGGCLLSFLLQQKLFHVPLPQSRTGLFLVPLMSFVLASALVAWPRPTWPVSLAAGILCIPLVVHQYNSFNLTYAVEWKPSGEVARMLDIIAKDHLPLSEQRPIVTVCSGFESWGSIPYYQRTQNMEWLVATVRRSPDAFTNSDYYIVEYDGYDQVDTLHWQMLYHSQACNTSLYRDRRWRDPDPVVLFHAAHDMEDSRLPGSSTSYAASGKHCILFTTQVRSAEPITWTVPADQAGVPIEFTASGMVLQPDDSDWITLVLTLRRGGREVEHTGVSSALQTAHFGKWNRVGISLRPSVPLEAGDSIQLLALPYTDDIPLYLDDLQMTVLR